MDYYKNYNYSKTSCKCENCPDYGVCTITQKEGKVVPKNLALTDCGKGDQYNCTDNLTYDMNQQPVLPTPTDYVNLNPNFGLTKAKDFFPCKCPEDANESPLARGKTCLETCNCAPTPCRCGLLENNTTMVSYDPRLIDPVRGFSMKLDAAPYEGNVKLKDVYDKKYDKYGQNYYTNYSDIHAGQINYYVDKSLASAYYNPVYTIRSDVAHQVFQDPMGSLKPQYERNPLLINNNNLSDYQFDRDQIGFREDYNSSK